MTTPDFIAMPSPLPTKTLAEVEREYITTVLMSVRGNKLHAARILGIDQSTLYRRLEKDKSLQQSAIAAYLKPKVIPSPKLNLPNPTQRKRKTPGKKISSDRQKEIDRYIEEIYDDIMFQ